MICLVTSRRQLAPEARTTSAALLALARWLEDAAGRVDLVQIRETDLDGASLERLTATVMSTMHGSGTRVVVNDRADVARDADGIHLPESGPPAGRVRELGPPGWIVGRSTHVPEATEAVRDADYVIFGTVFPTTSKPAGQPLAGVTGLAKAVTAIAAPVLAIGGIDAARAAECRAAGAAGVAAIGLFLPPGRAPGALGLIPAAEVLRAALGAE